MPDAAQVAGSFDSYRNILDDIKDRAPWEIRQTQFYKMRHDGLPRRNKPYIGAANLHFPLTDSLVERMKPFYVQQLYATDIFASFVSLKPQSDDETSAASSWFDYKLKQESNFEWEIICAIDYMLQTTRAVIKMYWDEDAKRLCFDTIDPIYLIVPKRTESFYDADRVVHIIHMSPEQYMRNESFTKKDDGFLKTITGRGTGVQGVSGGTVDLEIQKSLREGITFGQTDDQIVLWEIYERQKNGEILVSTYSPMRPQKENAIRKPFKLPYNKGMFKGGRIYPFVSFQREVKDKGWYSPRGLVETNASFETYGCKMWNGISDWLDFFGRPTLKAERDIGGNTTNIRMSPGQVLPFGVVPNDVPQPPEALSQELQNVRAMSEYRSQIPDLGAIPHFTPKQQAVRSATEINAATGQSGMSDDMRARIFRLSLAQLYRMAWSIYIQKDRENLSFTLYQELQTVPERALHGDYQILPNGSADSWNRGMQLQKAAAISQEADQNPYLDKGESTKLFVELLNPQWVKRIYKDPGLVAQKQANKQAMETAAIMLGQPITVEQGDDDKTHIQEMNAFVGTRQQTGESFDQRNASLMLQSLGQHGQALKQKKDRQAKQVEKSAAPYLQYLSQVVNGQVPETPGNVLQMPQQQQQPPQPTPADQIKAQQVQLQAQAQQAKQQLDQVKLATKTTLDKQKVASIVANALANLKKAGINITNNELNFVMQEMGLPSLGEQVQQEVMKQVSGGVQ